MALHKSTSDSLCLLATAKSVGSLVRSATLEKRKLSDGFIKVPLEFGYAIPVSSSSGQEVLWKVAKHKERWKPPMPTNTRTDRDRCAEIQAVHCLPVVVKAGTSSKLKGKMSMKTKRKKE